MKKLLKFLGITSLILITLGLVIYLSLHQSLPEGKKGPEAEALADDILTSLDYAAWDTTCLIQWTFPGGHHYTWDKERGYCEVKWGENRVLLNTSSLEGIAFTNEEEIVGNKAKKLVKKSWTYFANDSYWLCAPYKIRDEGTERRLVELENGEKALLVTYTSGGVTPGDAYLWKVDKKGLPLSFQMWVQIIPIGGLEFTWEDWQELPSGALISVKHHSSLFDSKLTNVKAGQTFEDLGLAQDIFLPLLNP